MSDPGNESLDEALRESGLVKKEDAPFDAQLAQALVPVLKNVGNTFGTGQSYELSIKATPQKDGSVTFWGASLVVIADNSKA